MRYNCAILAVIVIGQLCSDAFAQMGPGAVDVGNAAACFDPVTGRIIVSVNSVDFWYVQSATSSLTGSTPTFVVVPSAIITDNNTRIGQGSFAQQMTFFDHDLGNVATTGLPVSDLTLHYSADLGGSPETVVPVQLCVPEPQGMALIFAGVAMGMRLRPKHSYGRHLMRILG